MNANLSFLSRAAAASVAAFLVAVPASGQGLPLGGPSAAVTLVAPKRVPTGLPFQVRLRIDLTGMTGTCNAGSVPSVLGGFDFPITFPQANVAFVSAAGGTTTEFTSAPAFTAALTANANGSVVLANSQDLGTSPAGLSDVAVLTFNATGPRDTDVALTPVPGATGLSSAFQVCVPSTAGPVSLPAAATAASVHIGGSYFFPLTPCRAFDSRLPANAPALAANETRSVALGGVCGIDAAAVSVSANVTIVAPTVLGEAHLFPSDIPDPGTTTLPYRVGRTRANNATLALPGNGAGTVSVKNASAGAVDVIIDVNGYYK